MRQKMKDTRALSVITTIITLAAIIVLSIC